jgi:hypothetical protein
MRVSLDQDQWEAGAGTTLGDVLADVSDRAQAQSRIVTSLRIDQRAITDRDLDAEFLGKASGTFTRLTATSQSLPELLASARQAGARYAQNLCEEGNAIVREFRTGRSQVGRLDLWLGNLADYLELADGVRQSRRVCDDERPLSAWVQELLTARTGRDIVLMADLLEYEILPRLGKAEG